MVVVGNFRAQTELRKKPRRPFAFNARIATAKDTPLIACRIADISEGGARLCLARDEKLPQIFTLLLTPKATHGGFARSSGGTERRWACDLSRRFSAGRA
jgi:PilZ domain